jgi:RNA polymerase sigma factor (sigma-70 family)
VPSVWRFVYVRVHGDQHLAEDIVSECVLALIAAVSDPEKEISNLGGWLRSVAANKVNDHFRAAARVQHLLDQAQAGGRENLDGDPSEQQESKERRATIREVLDSLGDSQRMALEWKYIDKLSVREIAVRLDLTEKAAESILFRARREFRERLERNSDTVPAAKSPGQPDSGGDAAHVIRTATQRSPSSHPKPASPDEADEGDPERETRLQRGSFGTGRPTMHAEAARADSETESDVVEHPADAEHSIPGSTGE